MNKPNRRIWAENRIEVIDEEALHPFKLTVLNTFHVGGVIGPSFFPTMLTAFFWPELDAVDSDKI